MTKSDLIAKLALQAKISQKDANKIISILTDTITAHMSEGEKITISGFGTFERKRRKASMACNPKTGETMPIAEQNIATFRAGTSLKQAIKQEN